MSTSVTVVLTVKEAQALRYAAGNSTDAPDVMEALFPDPYERRAASIAMQKLRSAIVKATKP